MTTFGIMAARMARHMVILGVAALLGACGISENTTGDTSEKFLASLYNPSQLSLHPDYSIFHESNSYSVLYIRAYPAELRFNAANEDSEYRALLSLRYRLIKLEGPGLEGTLVDSASVTYKLVERNEDKPAFFASLKIPINAGARYILRLRVQDLNRGSLGLEYLYVDKTNPFVAQNFKIISLASGYPKFMSFFLPGEKFSIRYRDPALDSLYVQYYKLESELPRPPITASVDYTLDYTPDSSLTLHHTDTTAFGLVKKGMYFVRADRDMKDGLTLFNFGGSFPEVKTPTELMEPLFYLATMAEYRDLRIQSNRKLAVDDFWLKRGNSVEKSRELIRVYYNRVIYSNLYFTANKEGWKTDRGMIFILFGPPDRIRMTGSGETWYYFARRRSNAVEFRFDRRPDVFSNQHLEWVKTTESQVYWNEAVRSWRNGKVYSVGS